MKPVVFLTLAASVLVLAPIFISDIFDGPEGIIESLSIGMQSLAFNMNSLPKLPVDSPPKLPGDPKSGISNVSSSAPSGPSVKVFILAGQSNMVGMASVEHLKELISNSSSEKYQQLWDNRTNSFSVRDDVFIKFNNAVGNLTVGKSFAYNPSKLGVEVGFGWTVGDALASPVYLIKTAWGGRTLSVDFRPPMSGEGNYSNVPPHKYGWEYREMVDGIQKGLDMIPDVIPGYNGGNESDPSSYEISGFVWFQGWNDHLEQSYVDEYAFNLANLIRDVRREVQVPDLPIIVGEFGMHGLHPSEKRVLALRAAQRQPTREPEFRKSTLFVRTAQYAVNNGTTYEGMYHYNGRADTYYNMGKAFGKGMLKLMNIQK